MINRLLVSAMALLWVIAASLSAQTTYYSYLGASNPVWTNTNTWTTASTGGGFQGFGVPTLGPGSVTSGTGLATDNVVILSGATVFLPYDASTRTVASITIQAGGTLVITGTTANLTVTTLSGSGTLKLSTGGTVQWPTVTTPTTFIAASTGGTIELYGASLTVPVNPFQTASPYNNLTLSGSTANTKTISSTMTVSGNLVVDSACTMQFGVTSAAAGITLTVGGNLTINPSHTAATAISTPSVANTSANVLSLSGDFANYSQGTNGAQFCNLATQSDVVSPTTGYTSVQFVSTSQNQNLICNAPSRFWQIVCNKGVDDTYALNMSASAVANFNLFGRSNDADNAPNANQNNMLVPNGGTVRIGNNITITNLGTASNWNIPAAATVWIDGGANVVMAGTSLTPFSGNAFTTTTGGGLVPYGTIRVSTGGRLIVNKSQGLVMRVAGSIFIDGGTIICTSMTPSTAGGTHRGAFTMTGGMFRFLNGGGQRETGAFVLSNPVNNFIMTGGTIRVDGMTQNSNNAAQNTAINIQSAIGNYNVTGGTIVVNHTGLINGGTSNAVNWLINSSVPFFNARFVRSGTSTASIQLNTYSAGGTVPAPTNANAPLVVLNNLTLQDSTSASTTNAVLDMNDRLLQVYGDFTLVRNPTQTANNIFRSGTTATTGKVQFLGTGRSRLENQTNSALSIAAFDVRKSGADSTQVELRSSTGSIAGGANIITVTDSLIISGGTLNYRNFVVNHTGTRLVNRSGRLGVVGTTGSVTMAGTAAQTIVTPTTSTGLTTFGNLIINNGGNLVTLSGGQIDTIRSLALTSASIFNIGTNGILVTSAIQGSGGGTSAASFSTTRYIRTAGGYSDGGVRLQATTSTNIIYPVGMNVSGTDYYLPFTANYSALTGSGFVQANPVNGFLATLNGASAANALNMYWRVRRSSGLTAGTVTTYNGQSNAFFFPGGVLPGANWASGYVLSASRNLLINTTTGALSGSTVNFVSAGAPAHTLQTDATYSAANADGIFSGNARQFFSRRGVSQFYGSWTDGTRWNVSTLMTPSQLQNPHVDYGVGVTGLTPGAGDIAYIGYDSTNVTTYSCHVMFYEGTATPIQAAQLVFRTQPVFGGANTWADRPFFQIRGAVNMTAQFGSVTGDGVFAVGLNPGFTVDLTTIDFGGFNNSPNAIFLYQPMVNGFAVHTMPSFPTTFPTLRSYSGAYAPSILNVNDNITILNDLLLDGGTRMILGNGAGGNITVGRDMILSVPTSGWAYSQAALQFQSSGTARTLSIGRDLVFADNYPTAGVAPDSTHIFVDSTNATQDPTLVHTVSVGRNISYLGTFSKGLSLYSSAANARGNLILSGSSNATISDAGSNNQPVILVNQLQIAKTSSSNTVTVTKPFFARAAANGAATTKPIYLVTGKLIMNLPAARTYNLSTGGSDFTIPIASSLILQNNVNATITNTTGNLSGITLNGGLYIRGNSTLTMTGDGAGQNLSSIVYSAAGNARLELSSTATPALSLDGPIRRNSLSDGGTMQYFQSAGSVLVGTGVRTTAQTSVPNNRGVFDIENNVGSSFTMTGGTLTIAEARNGTSIADLYLFSATDTITGGTIALGNTTPRAAAITIRVNTNKTLFNLTVNAGQSAANRVTGQSYIAGITVGNDLTINNFAGYDPNSLGLTVGRNVVVTGDGRYNTSNSVHTLTLASATNASPGLNLATTGTYNFSSITLNNTAVSGNLSFTGAQSAISLSGNLTLTSGTFTLGTGNVSVGGNISNSTTVAGSGFIVTNKVTVPVPTIGGNGSGVFNNLRIGTSLGATMTATQTINNQLDFSTGAGVLDIGVNQLTFAASALNPTVNAGAGSFSSNTMIQLSGTPLAAGVVRTFTNSQTISNVLWPIGVLGKYTPARFESGTVTASGGGAVAIRPINNTNLAVTTPANTNVLTYYWTVIPGTFAASALTHTYEFLQSDASGIAFDGSGLSTTPASYIPGYFFVGAGSWVSGVVADVYNNVAVPAIPAGSARARFTNIVNLNADYTAGNIAKFGTVVTYTTRTGQSGNWDNTTTLWSTSGAGGAACGCSPVISNPTQGGAGAVVVSSGTSVTVPTGLPGNGAYATSTTIDGTLDIAATTGNNLTTVAGAGTMRLSPTGPSANWPSANFTSFLGTGSVEYYGANNYTLPNNTVVPSYNNLSFTGTAGTATLADSLTVNGNLTLGGSSGTATLGLSNLGLRLAGNLTRTANGALNAGTGVLRFFGTGNSNINSAFTGGNAPFNVIISKTGGANVTVNGGTFVVSNRVLFNTGLVNTTATNILQFAGSNAVALNASTSSFVNGPVSVVTTSTSQNFTFPTGASSRYQPIQMLTAGPTSGTTWTAQYFFAADAFASNVTGGGITGVSQAEYWSLATGGSTQSAGVNINWGTGSASPPITLGQIIVASRGNSQTSWSAVASNAATGALTNGNVASSGTVSFAAPNTTTFFTIGSSSGTLPVSWLMFTGTRVENGVQLRWSTASELNNDRFEVQRSADGSTFVKVGAVLGNGTTTNISTYTYLDSDAPATGTLYYRLRQVDYDGTDDYSIVVEVGEGVNNSNTWVAYPNPFDGRELQVVTKDADMSLSAAISYRVLSTAGNEIAARRTTLSGLTNDLRDVVADLAPGMYVLMLQSPKGYSSLRLVKR
jgi:hypothetical protein